MQVWLVPGGSNLDKRTPGALSLVRKFIQEATPSDIVDGLGQHAAGHPFDIEVFHDDHAVVIPKARETLW